MDEHDEITLLALRARLPEPAGHTQQRADAPSESPYFCGAMPLPSVIT